MVALDQGVFTLLINNLTNELRGAFRQARLFGPERYIEEFFNPAVYPGRRCQTSLLEPNRSTNSLWANSNCRFWSVAVHAGRVHASM
jgi:hypothetical protein